LRSTFGDTLEGPLAEIVVRNWGALIALVGAMLIYGAYTPPVRRLVLSVAGLSKLVFIVLVLSQGTAISASRQASRSRSMPCGWCCSPGICWRRGRREGPRGDLLVSTIARRSETASQTVTAHTV
jgi:hypothetical protein